MALGCPRLLRRHNFRAQGRPGPQLQENKFAIGSRTRPRADCGRDRDYSDYSDYDRALPLAGTGGSELSSVNVVCNGFVSSNQVAGFVFEMGSPFTLGVFCATT